MKKIFLLFCVSLIFIGVACTSGEKKNEDSTDSLKVSSEQTSKKYEEYVGFWRFISGRVEISRMNDSLFMVKQSSEGDGECWEYVVKGTNDGGLKSIDHEGLFYKQELPVFKFFKKDTVTFDCGIGPFELIRTTKNSNDTASCVKLGSRYSKNDDKLVGKWIQVDGDVVKYKQGVELLKDGSAKSIKMKALNYKKWWVEKDVLYLELDSVGAKGKSTSTVGYGIYKLNERIMDLQGGDENPRYFSYERR